MKKILLLFIIFPTLAFAGSDDIKKSGFLKKPISTKVDKLEITEPKNKIIIIFNHGQSSNDSKKLINSSFFSPDISTALSGTHSIPVEIKLVIFFSNSFLTL